MNEIEAQDCYDAIGILLAHRDELDSIIKTEKLTIAPVPAILDAIQQTLIDYLPCQCEFYTVTDTIRHNHDDHLEVEVTCDNCGKVGLKLFQCSNENVSWNS